MEKHTRREKLRELIVELLLPPASESRIAEISVEIDKLSPDPQWSDYIYHSMEFYDENDQIIVDKLIEKILAYKTINL